MNDSISMMVKYNPVKSTVRKFFQEFCKKERKILRVALKIDFLSIVKYNNEIRCREFLKFNLIQTDFKMRNRSY